MSYGRDRGFGWLPFALRPRLLDALQVGIGACIYFDLVPDVDKEGDIDDGSRFEGGRLRTAGGGIAFDAGIGIGDFKFDKAGHFGSEYFAVMLDDVDFHT